MYAQRELEKRGLLSILLLFGFIKSYARARGGAEYTRRKFKTMTEGIEVSVHPGSSLFSRRRQDAMGAAGRHRKHFVVFTELVLTKKAYMRGVSNIDGAWLRELAPQCFS